MKSLPVFLLILVMGMATADNILVAHSLGMGSHISIPHALSRQGQIGSCGVQLMTSQLDFQGAPWVGTQGYHNLVRYMLALKF